MPSLKNIAYLLIFTAASQAVIVGVMYFFELGYIQAANWVFGLLFILITIGTIRVFMQSRKTQERFVDMQKQLDFSKETDVMLVQYRALIERLDDSTDKERLLKELDLIEAINKSGDELYASPSTNQLTIDEMKQNLQRLEDSWNQRKSK